MAMAQSVRQKILITGAAGGMGRACARLFGATHDLILSDVVAERLEDFAKELQGEGYTIVATHAGDLGDAKLLRAIVGDLDGNEPFTVLHTAGLSPSQADWRSIMAINLMSTEKLVQAVEPILRPGSVAVLIASTAGHSMPAIPDMDALLDAPLVPDFMDKIGVMVEAMAPMAGPAGAGGISYSMSKRGVLRLCERKAAAWGKNGARIVSISPGLILTPMGRKELAETPGAAQVDAAAPAGRSGMAMDIALTARFLASDEASFITGSDLRVDGGSTAAMRFPAG
jgi:NAD(P)-dependent dehydrogenase (short-subunit alcohol dehydrogenase family)